MLDTIHLLTADLVAALVVVALAWSLLNLISRRDPSARYTAYLAAVVSAVIVAAVAGGFMFLTGDRPTDGLHFLYAGLAIAIVPLARSYLLGSGRRDRIVLLIALGLLAGFVYRLFTTG